VNGSEDANSNDSSHAQFKRSIESNLGITALALTQQSHCYATRIAVSPYYAPCLVLPNLHGYRFPWRVGALCFPQIIKATADA
jgi:hypothetical protein